MNSIILAALINLAPGYNNIGQSGEVVAVNAATAEAAATVNLQKVSTLTTYTNVTAEVVSYEPAWRVTVTNFERSTIYKLPADAFPITYTDFSAPEGSQSQTITDNSGISFAVNGDYVDACNKSVVSLGYGEPIFSTFNLTDLTWSQCYAPIQGLTFGDASPIENESPVLTSETTPATYVTNVVGHLDRSVFVWTNGVSTIVGEPVRFDMAITNEVVTGQAIANVYTATNDLATVTTADHFGSATTNAFLFGDGILVTGAAEGDSIKILIK